MLSGLSCFSTPFNVGYYAQSNPVLTQTLWLAAFLAWSALYWWFALSRGLRMREAPTVMIACGVPALLAAIGALLAHPGTLTWFRWV
jgi:hypothetical protein